MAARIVLALHRAAIAERREVGDEAHEPEQQRRREVRRDGEHVPHERAAELRPHRAHVVRDRNHPPREPRTAGVEQREQTGRHDGEDRHRLGRAVDADAPVLASQVEHGGDQRAGVTDTDPPDEVRDVPRPADGVRVTPHADAGRDQVIDADEADAEHE